MNRIYLRKNEPGEHRLVRRVDLRETYRGSCHWQVLITPEGYGSDPEPLEFCKRNNREVLQEEGYGIFRIEMAVYLAQSLTGNKEYIEDPGSSG